MLNIRWSGLVVCIGRGLLLLLLLPMTVRPQDQPSHRPYFPEGAFFPEDPTSNRLKVDRLTVQLEAFQEPSLWLLSRRDSQVSVYRFLWLSWLEHPTCVRVAKSGESYTMHLVRHDGTSGFSPGEIVVRRDSDLSRESWEGLTQRLSKLNFDTMPTEVPENQQSGDVTSFVVEGIHDGKYHVVERAGSAASDEFKELCRYLLMLAGEDILKEWDHSESRLLKVKRPENPKK